MAASQGQTPGTTALATFNANVAAASAVLQKAFPGGVPVPHDAHTLRKAVSLMHRMGTSLSDDDGSRLSKSFDTASDDTRSNITKHAVAVSPMVKKSTKVRSVPVDVLSTLLMCCIQAEADSQAAQAAAHDEAKAAKEALTRGTPRTRAMLAARS